MKPESKHEEPPLHLAEENNQRHQINENLINTQAQQDDQFARKKGKRYILVTILLSELISVTLVSGGVFTYE